MHTNHTNPFGDHFQPATNLTQRDWEQAQQLLGLLKQKVKYKQKDLFRERQKIREAETSFEEEKGEGLAEDGEPDPSLSREWEFLLEGEALIAALTRLSPRHQELLWLLVVEGKTQQEIATLWGVSPAAISQTKNRVSKQIKLFLEKEEGGDRGR